LKMMNRVLVVPWSSAPMYSATTSPWTGLPTILFDLGS
jgi:hypothetical protein